MAIKRLRSSFLSYPHLVRLIVAGCVGMFAGFLCSIILMQTTGQAGDFGWALEAASDIWTGQDVYRRPFGHDRVPYPLPAAFVALPLVHFPPPVAAGIFWGLSSMLLAWCLLRSGNLWSLLIFLSWPYVYGLIFAQWLPLIVCMAFMSSLLPLLLVKPQSAIPLLLFHPFTRRGIFLLLAVGLVSLAVYPLWPIAWLKQISGYRGITPPLFNLPLGPLLLLALLRFRDRNAWFFLLLAIMPQRVVYDQLALLLLARSRAELIFLLVCSWITLPALLVFGGWQQLPGGWQLWIVLTLYLPALFVLLRKRQLAASAEHGQSTPKEKKPEQFV